MPAGGDPGGADPTARHQAGGGRGGAGSRRRASRARRSRHRKRRSFWRELPILIVIALIIALLIKTFVLEAFFIPSGSMEDTLKIGDRVLVSKLVYKLRPGDIVVFNGVGSWNSRPPAVTSSNPVVRLYDATLAPLVRAVAGLFGTEPGQDDYIKRVIGVPGDKVACCNARGLVTVNGVALHEKSYLYPGEAPGDAPPGYPGRFHITVPPARLWVLGDHRGISADSRLHRDRPGGGTIPESAVIGRAVAIVWPPSRWRTLPVPATFDQPGITRLAAASGQRRPAGAAVARLDAALLTGVPVAPPQPYLPLAAGLLGAMPLTALQRRVRVRGWRVWPGRVRGWRRSRR